jgi:hypothetical protein
MPEIIDRRISFNAGEISPWLDPRVDLDKYQMGCRTLQNMRPSIYGGAMARAGTQYMGAAAVAGSAVRLIPFVVGISTNYLLELSALKIRVWNAETGELVEVDGLPLEIVTPYLAAELNEIQYAQQNDIMYFTHPLHPPQRLGRYSDTSWDFLTADFSWPSTMGPNITDVALSVVAGVEQEAEPPAWASNVTYVAGDLVKHRNIFYRAKYWNRVEPGVHPSWDDYWRKTSWAPDLSPAQLLGRGKLVALHSNLPFFEAGHVGSQFVIGHRRNDLKRSINLKTAVEGEISDAVYTLGEWTVSVTAATDVTNELTVKLVLERSFDLETWETAYPVQSGTGSLQQLLTGTEEQPAFLRLKLISKTGSLPSGSYGAELEAANPVQNGIVTVLAVDSETLAQARVEFQIASEAETTLWEEGAWSARSGYPRAVTLHENRLYMGGTVKKPTTIWGSAVDSYRDFRVAANDDNAVSWTLMSDESSSVEWLVSQDMLVIGTTSGEWVLGQRPGDDVPRLRRNTSFGSAPIQARAIADAIVFVQRSRRKGREFAWSFERDGYVANDLSMLSEHLGDARFLQIAIQRNPESVVWIITERGDLLTLTYERGQNVAGWARHTTQGTFESVAVVNNGAGEEDQVWMVAVRSLNGQTVRCIERIAPDMIRVIKTGERKALYYSDCSVKIQPVLSATSDVFITGVSDAAGEVAVPELLYQGQELSRPSYESEGQEAFLNAELPKATATVNPAGDNNSIAIEAVTGGAAGNDISVEILERSGATVDVSVSGDAVTITPGIESVKAEKLFTIQTLSTQSLCRLIAKTAGSAGNDINIRFVGTADPSPTGPYQQITSEIVVTNNDIVVYWTPTQQIYRASLLATHIAASAAADLVEVVVINDSLNPQWSSVATYLEAGTDGLVGTANEIIEAINADSAAAALVVASNAAGSDGSGAVAAVGPVDLTGGSDTPRWRLVVNDLVWFGNDTATLPWDVPAEDWEAVFPATGVPVFSALTTNITGLDHLEGEEVSVLADGSPHRALTVTGGAVRLDYTAGTVVVGLPYEMIIEPTPTEAAQVAEFSKAGKKRITRMVGEFWNTSGVEISADGGTTWTPMESRTALDAMDSAGVLFTGLREEYLEGGTARQTTVKLRSTQPLPFNLLSLTLRYNLEM